ncbi:MAG TPA: ATP-binding protein [Dokdonella sp.]|uniref:sensor histidine kinase n=1 Tax=Dokdonella sp. TaxID=2291710 RepID=UPI002D11ED97|nr:ATP-binding protein [Dokdonella sp.]HUD42066.1 ATP-binding protein [Dokdonella sp.]
MNAIAWAGWIVAAALLVAGLMAHGALRRERERASSLERGKQALMEELTELEARQVQAAQAGEYAGLGQIAAGFCRELARPLGAARNNVQLAGGQIADYRALVKAYDAAVQYCLQPVELILGADPASLDNVVRHVEGARAKLFQARRNLERSAFLDEARDLLGDADAGLARLDGIARELGAQARGEREDADWVDLNALVDSVLDATAHLRADRIELRRERAELPRMRAVPGQLGRMVLNLVTNAVQAMPANGRLTVATRHGAGGTVEIEIADSGHGIDDDVLARIFEPFFTTRAVGQGLGIGLAVVHRIVKAHGGSIQVHTASGGSRFVVSLPAAGSAADALAVPPLAAA